MNLIYFYNMERLEGVISNITFQNEDNGFCVVQLQTNNRLVTCVGTIPSVSKGESVCVEGTWEKHKKFGQQFTISSYEIVRPTTIEGITQLLGSGLIKNVGAVRSKQIIDTFGLDTLTIMDEDPDRLGEVPGIGKKTLEKIKDSWAEQRHLRDLMMFLQSYGISLALATRIYKAYGKEAKQKISENPYSLIEKVWGIGFKKADTIAVRMGLASDSYRRIRAGLTFSLQEAAGDGHTFLPKEELLARSSEVLNVPQEQITFSLDHCILERILRCEENSVYLPTFYRAEKNVAADLKSRIGDVRSSIHLTAEEINSWLTEYQKRNNWTGAPEQLEAVRNAFRNNLFLLTGGPGTGKTTVLQVIVALFRSMRRKIELAAPTGRAAQRMGSISGVTARTIHRLLGFKPGGQDGFSFLKNRRDPIDADVIILDEVSMVDIQLMKNFLDAVKPDCTLILVGDQNQLPSVGAGNVLSDLISSGVIPHVQLTKVFRQAAQSRIVTAAHEMINGTVPQFLNAKADNCFFLSEEDPQKCVDTIVDLVSRRLPSRYGYNPLQDIQVLSPMHKGTLGTVNLNTVLQSALNHDRSVFRFGQHTFILGDRVMQTRNNYDLGVYNGDIGTITAITEEAVAVTYDKMPIFYEQKNLEEIVPAYCISIHKSQGSEFRAVVIPVSTQHFVMLQRNLIYTALTRAKELCILIGSKKALSLAVRNDRTLRRYSRLGELIGFKSAESA
ncbi:MAG: ATP-dependent RecD-like DNA helicase [Fibrobacterota bacterium]